ncbi:hypothetical protein RhiirA1_534613 [Rhizophagus irregularis]|uniref:DUF8211 domain-containing protein n=2 Tax=Rhizophagus irregularis TaxID=588596 RepID=A0A2N0RX37_9GLOM|nr:hypothetical protein RhiirA1_534613 [Rhizophagus irregularis]
MSSIVNLSINDTLIEDNVSSNTSFPLISTSSIVDNSFLVSFEKFHVTKVKESEQQQQRFERSYKRIFAKSKPKAGQTHKLADKLAISKQYRFLFLPSQYVNKPVRYLKYNTLKTAPNVDAYPFLILCYTRRAQQPSRKSPVVVPPELILDTTPLRHHTQIKDKVPQKKAYDFESVRVVKNGTSVKRLRLRDIQKQSLTDINDAFHEHMYEFRKRARRTTAPLHPKWLVEEMKEFTDRFPIACQHMKADLLQDSYNVDFSMTSDDAKEVKTHHNKRTVTNNYNLDFSYSKPDEKRQRHHDKRIFDPHDAFKYF